MEALARKYQQKYMKAREEMALWEELQSRLLSHFGNAAAVIERLEVLREPKHYGGLASIDGIKEALLGKQLEMLERNFSIMKDTLKQFHSIVVSLEKISRDGSQLLKCGSTPKALHMKIGIKPSLAECVDGLKIIHEIHQSEYVLKLSLISALTWNSSSSDLVAIRQLLVDQPNISKDKDRHEALIMLHVTWQLPQRFPNAHRDRCDQFLRFHGELPASVKAMGRMSFDDSCRKSSWRFAKPVLFFLYTFVMDLAASIQLIAGLLSGAPRPPDATELAVPDAHGVAVLRDAGFAASHLGLLGSARGRARRQDEGEEEEEGQSGGTARSSAAVHGEET